MTDAHPVVSEPPAEHTAVEGGADAPKVEPLSALPLAEQKSPINSPESLNFVMDVPVELRVELGRKRTKIGDLLRLGPGSVLELEKPNGEALDLYVNDRLIAKGDAVVVGERYGLRLTEVLINQESLGEDSE